MSEVVNRILFLVYRLMLETVTVPILKKKKQFSRQTIFTESLFGPSTASTVSIARSKGHHPLRNDLPVSPVRFFLDLLSS